MKFSIFFDLKKIEFGVEISMKILFFKKLFKLILSMYHGWNLCFKVQKVLQDLCKCMQRHESPSKPIFVTFEGNHAKKKHFEPIFRSNICEMPHVPDLKDVGHV